MYLICDTVLDPSLARCNYQGTKIQNGLKPALWAFFRRLTLQHMYSRYTFPLRPNTRPDMIGPARTKSILKKSLYPALKLPIPPASKTHSSLLIRWVSYHKSCSSGLIGMSRLGGSRGCGKPCRVLSYLIPNRQIEGFLRLNITGASID